MILFLSYVLNIFWLVPEDLRLVKILALEMSRKTISRSESKEWICEYSLDFV